MNEDGSWKWTMRGFRFFQIFLLLNLVFLVGPAAYASEEWSIADARALLASGWEELKQEKLITYGIQIRELDYKTARAVDVSFTSLFPADDREEWTLQAAPQLLNFVAGTEAGLELEAHLDRINKESMKRTITWLGTQINKPVHLFFSQENISKQEVEGLLELTLLPLKVNRENQRVETKVEVNSLSAGGQAAEVEATVLLDPNKLQPLAVVSVLSRNQEGAGRKYFVLEVTAFEMPSKEDPADDRRLITADLGGFRHLFDQLLSKSGEKYAISRQAGGRLLGSAEGVGFEGEYAAGIEEGLGLIIRLDGTSPQQPLVLFGVYDQLSLGEKIRVYASLLPLVIDGTKREITGGLNYEIGLDFTHKNWALGFSLGSINRRQQYSLTLKYYPQSRFGLEAGLGVRNSGPGIWLGFVWR
ncbi:MAG: hypothetical protein GX335_10305 [Firmicutes bacterium]|nr:hypothetical protein [Bacillota bacterium]